MKDITIVIKTFERPKRLKRLLETIRPRFPSLPIFVADDRRRPRRPENVDQLFEMSYDSGVSAGRNRNKYGETAGCIVCDKVKNFLMARTSRVREFGGWPDELKIGEHLPFFVRAMGELKVAYFPGARRCSTGLVAVEPGQRRA